MCLFLDKLYGNNNSNTTADGSNTSYGTFYPEATTYSSVPVSSATTTTASSQGDIYSSMPPPIDQQSPYSYGYGEEKKKMLTQEQSNIQGSGNYSMYNTAYPSSVTGGQLYSNYGEYGAAH